MSSIRDATPVDADAIASVYNESVAARDSTMQLSPVDVHVVRHWITDLGEREAVIVLQDDQTVAGWGSVKRYSDREGYHFTAETSVYIRRDRRGRGYGPQLQEVLLARSSDFGYHHLVAKIWANHRVSLEMHRRFGYEVVGVQREIGFVDGGWQDVAILQKILETPQPDD